MKTNSIGFIGGGRITRIFLQAFQNKSVVFEKIKVYEPNTDTFQALKSSFSGIEKAQSAEEIGEGNVVVIAVHPPMVMESLEKIKGIVKSESLVFSLAPKITIEKIVNFLQVKNVVRMIPNATSFINEGYNPVAFHLEMSEQVKASFFDMVRPLGDCFEVLENKLEGYAIVSAMLPTYFWFQWKEMEKIAMETGLDKVEAQKTIQSTLNKSISLFYNSGLSSEEVIDLIPVKPIGENEDEIKSILNAKLLGLYSKLKS